MSKILFIAPRFYSYHEYMSKEFAKQGNEVDYFDDRPGTNFFTKVLIRINKNLIKRKINKYFSSILIQAKKKQYDIVLVIYGQSFSCDMFQKLKNELPNAKFIFYMYDPIASMPDRLEVAKIFDIAYTFDIEDFEKYDVFKFLPLFYSTDNYQQRKIKYDYCLLTTMMPGKYQKTKEIISELKSKSNNTRIYNFSYLQSKLVWLFYKLTKKEFRHSKAKEFQYKRKTYSESNTILEESSVIIDCPKENQTGLTIRTLECLAANKKMITTNKTIVKYDFYKPENIYVYDGSLDFNNVFFKSEYKEVEKHIKEQYSLENWAKKILS